jgi:hypothetical protein
LPPIFSQKLSIIYMSEFKWTDELVKEFVKFPILARETSKDVVDMNMRHFKEYVTLRNEKPVYQQPKQDWEIVERCGAGRLPIDYLNWPIHSVKRLSDGEVFTVGDRVGYGFDVTPNQFFIESFHIYDKWMAVRGGGVEAVDITLLNRSAGDVCPLTHNEIKQLRKILYCK